MRENYFNLNIRKRFDFKLTNYSPESSFTSVPEQVIVVTVTQLAAKRFPVSADTN